MNRLLTDPAPSGPSTAARLPGREREVSQLRQLLDEARTGAGGVAYIEAGMGAGKSRLLATARAMAQAAGVTCLRATGRHGERQFDCGVIVQLLAEQPRCAATEDLMATSDPARRLLQRLSLPSSGQRSDWFPVFHGLFGALRDFTLHGSSDPHAVAIVVDDLNAADEPSLRFLAYIAARSADLPIALVVAARRGEPETDPQSCSALRKAAGSRLLRPGNLPPSVVEEIVRKAYAHADSSVVAAFGEASAGNPLLLAALLAETCQVTGDEAAPAAHEIADLMPDAVVASVESQLAALPAEAAGLARAVAELGSGASLTAAELAAQLVPGTAARCGDALAAAGLLQPGSPLRFAAPLMERMLARSVPPLQAAELRRRAAGPSDPGESHQENASADNHVRSSGEPRSEPPLSAAQRAMDSSVCAEPSTRTRELVELAWQGAVAGDSDTDDVAAAALLPLALVFADELERAEEILSDPRFEQLTGGADRSPTAACCRTWMLYHLGQVDAAISVAQAARESLAADAGSDAYRLGCAIAACRIEQGLLADADTELAVAVPAAAMTVLDRLVMLETRAQLRLAQKRMSDALDDALEAGRLADAGGGRLEGAVPWRSTAALARVALGQRASARSLIEAEVALARRRSTTRGMLRALRVQAIVATGRQRLELLAEAVGFGDERPARLEYLRALVDYGMASRRANQRSAARVPLRAALDVCRAAGATTLAERASEELAAIESVGSHGRRPKLGTLTPSERRVADLAAQGLTTRQIATELFVTPKTVEFHLRHVYHKLQIPSSRAELTAALRISGPRNLVGTGQ